MVTPHCHTYLLILCSGIRARNVAECVIECVRHENHDGEKKNENRYEIALNDLNFGNTAQALDYTLSSSKNRRE